MNAKRVKGVTYHQLSVSMTICHLVKSLDHPSKAWNAWSSWLGGRYRQVTLPESDLKNLSLTIVSDNNDLKAMPEHSPRHQRIFEGDGCVKCVGGWMNKPPNPIPQEEW